MQSGEGALEVRLVNGQRKEVLDRCAPDRAAHASLSKALRDKKSSLRRRVLVSIEVRVPDAQAHAQRTLTPRGFAVEAAQLMLSQQARAHQDPIEVLGGGPHPSSVIIRQEAPNCQGQLVFRPGPRQT
jgi:hypothetical protein